jgi:hypothetical protein
VIFYWNIRVLDVIEGTTWGWFFWVGQKILSAAVGVEMQKNFLDHPQKTILITH